MHWNIHTSCCVPAASQLPPVTVPSTIGVAPDALASLFAEVSECLVHWSPPGKGRHAHAQPIRLPSGPAVPEAGSCQSAEGPELGHAHCEGPGHAFIPATVRAAKEAVPGSAPEHAAEVPCVGREKNKYTHVTGDCNRTPVFLTSSGTHLWIIGGAHYTAVTWDIGIQALGTSHEPAELIRTCQPGQ